MTKEPLVSVVILSFNRCKELQNTLDHIKLIDYPNLEVVVFDNGSKDGTAEMVKSHAMPVSLIGSEDNIGIAGYNHAVQASNGEIIVILDDDSFVAPEAVKIAIHVLSADEGIGVLAFKILLSDGSTSTVNWKRETPSFWGCGAAIRRKVWDMVGGYDPDFFLYLNEVDMAIRVRNAGYKVIYDDRCIAYHMVSRKNRASSRLIFFSTRNVVWFHLKHIPFRQIARTSAAHLLSYFTLSIIGGCPLSWLKGLLAGIKGRDIALKKRQAVAPDVVKFYRDNDFMWQWPFRQLLIKLRSEGLKIRSIVR